MIRLLLALTAAAVAVVGVLAAPSGSARSRPTCYGKRATMVGTNHRDVISGTRGRDVIVARGGNDVIRAKSIKANHGEDIVCGGSGDDRINGNGEDNVLIGGRGNDTIKGSPGDDFIVGDNVNLVGNESGKTGRDYLNGTGGRDFLVGDNFAVGDASGATADKDIVGLDNGDKLIGDSASLDGDAKGGAADRLAGADGNDLVVGDSYAPHGKASGSGNDKKSKAHPRAGINAGPGNDIVVGDNYTRTGTASGGGRDQLHAADGGDADARCRPHTCDDVFYGDNYSAGCGPRATHEARACQLHRTSGGGADLLSTDQGNDFLNGGPPDDPDLRGKGDKCAGGRDRDAATRCEYVYKDVEVKIKG